MGIGNGIFSLARPSTLEEWTDRDVFHDRQLDLRSGEEKRSWEFFVATTRVVNSAKHILIFQLTTI